MARWVAHVLVRFIAANNKNIDHKLSKCFTPDEK